VKLYKKKAPKKRREKETKGKDKSPGKQTAQKRRAGGKGTTKMLHMGRIFFPDLIKKLYVWISKNDEC